MFTRFAGLALGMWLACAGVTQAAEPPMVAKLKGTIDVSADGKVEAQRLHPSLGDPLDKAIRRQIAAWTFEPVIEGGKAVPVRSRVELSLEAVRDGMASRVRIADVRFLDPPRPGSGPQPQRVPLSFPQRGVSNWTGADVRALLQVNADGTVREVAIDRMVLLATRTLRGKDERMLAEAFTLEVTRKLGQWRYPASMVEGLAPEDRVFCVNVDFNLEGTPWSRPVQVATVVPDWARRTPGVRIAEFDAAGNRVSESLRMTGEPDGDGTL